MTMQNMACYRKDPNYPFWVMLKEEYDLFEIGRIPPNVDVCERSQCGFPAGNASRGKVLVPSPLPALTKRALLQQARTIETGSTVFYHAVIENQILPGCIRQKKTADKAVVVLPALKC